MEWQHALEIFEWNERDRHEHYLAQIAKEIHDIACMLGGGKAVPTERFLLRFTTDPSVQPALPAPKKPDIEVGSEAMKHPGWAQTNMIAKAGWMQRLHLKEIPA
jgi:hypothetical protein